LANWYVGVGLFALLENWAKIRTWEKSISDDTLYLLFGRNFSLCHLMEANSYLHHLVEVASYIRLKIEVAYYSRY
jgi:hypothetical protein